MTALTGLFAACILLFSTYVIYTIVKLDWWGRLAGVVSLAGFALISYLALADLLGRPRPAEISVPEGAKVVAFQTDGVDMWVWVWIDGEPTPIAVGVGKYNPETAKAMEEQKNKMARGAVHMRRGPEGEWVLHPPPQRSSPPKADETR